MKTNLILNILQSDIFGIAIMKGAEFLELVFRFAFDLAVTLVIVRLIYYPKNKRKDYLFTYILIGISVFLLCVLLESVDLQLGFALGLFAIFGIIRYRTNSMPIKEMTYLFLIIAVSVINALSGESASWVAILFTNTAIIGATFLLERVFLLEHQVTKTIVYEKIDLIKPENQDSLLKDLEERTGLKIKRIEIGEINFLRDTAIIRIFYFEKKSAFSFSNDINLHRFNDDDDE
jgi:hypothetical protein